MLRLRCSTAAAVVLVWASALHAQPVPPAPTTPAPAPAAPAAPAAPGESAAFPPIEPQPNPEPQLQAPPAPPAPEPPKEEKPSYPDRLSIGKHGGFLQVGGLIQIWGVVAHVDDQNTTNTFRLRRAEVQVRGEILPKLLAYRVMFDVAKLPVFTNTNVAVRSTDSSVPSPGTVTVPQPGPDRSVLQDVFMTYMSDYADVSIGEFKIPVSLEALQSGTRLLFPERHRVTREYGDRRDVGIRIDKKIGDVFYYYAGVFNGQGQNVQDTDKAKDVGLRLEAYPIPGLLIGAVAYGTVGAGDGNERNRLEGDLRLELGDFIAQGEYIHAWTGPESRRLEGHGAYGALAYMIAGCFQPAARVGFLDTNLNDLPPANVSESGVQRQFEFGLNYLVKKIYEAKLTGAFAYYSQENGPDTSEFTLAAQAAF